MAKRRQFIPCTAKDTLPTPELRLLAAQKAVEVNPANAAPEFGLQRAMGLTMSALGAVTEHVAATAEHLALITSKWWGPKVRLTVSFMDTNDQALIQMILSHLNAWGQYGDIVFSWTQRNGQVRIARDRPENWSFMGTDILAIPPNQPTMMLGGMTLKTPERERRRVIRHEAGHTLAFPHEHCLPEIIAKIDPAKAIPKFMREQGWTAQEVKNQVLTPPDPRHLRMTVHANQNGIMCYRITGDITYDGKDIPGGEDIDAIDGEFCGKQYPLTVPPSPPVSLDGITFAIATDLITVTAPAKYKTKRITT